MPQSIIINSVDRALDIINYLFDKGEEVSLTMISKELGIYKSTAFRTLMTLMNKGFVEQNKETEKYMLGTRLFVIGTGIEKQMGLIRILKPYVEELNSRFGETVNVAVLEKTKNWYESIIIYKAESYHTLVVDTNVGSKNECYCSSVGKCLLAFGESLDPSIYNEDTMIQYTKNTITNEAGLKKELEMIREKGYAIDDEERETGLVCLGVPILQNGYAVASISMSGPTTRMKEKLNEKIETLLKVGENASLELSRR